MEQEYQDITRPREVREEVKKLRKKFLRYQEAAGALYRMEKKTPSGSGWNAGTACFDRLCGHWCLRV